MKKVRIFTVVTVALVIGAGIFHACEKDSQETSSIKQKTETTQTVAIQTVIEIGGEEYPVTGNAIMNTANGTIYEACAAWTMPAGTEMITASLNMALKPEYAGITTNIESVMDNYTITVAPTSMVTPEILTRLWESIVAFCNAIPNYPEDVNYQRILTVAENHNRYLDEIFENFDFTSTNPMQELKNSIYAANLDGLSYDEKVVIWGKFQANDFKTTTTDDLINIIRQSDIYSNKDRVIELITMINEDNFIGGMPEINSRIEEIQNIANNELTSVEDISVVLLYTEVLRKSAEYWLPIELGGNGHGQQILYAAAGSSSGKDAAKIVAADAGSMAAGFTVAAFVGAFFPPVGVGTLIAVVVNGAIASGIQAVANAVAKK